MKVRNLAAAARVRRGLAVALLWVHALNSTQAAEQILSPAHEGLVEFKVDGAPAPIGNGLMIGGRGVDSKYVASLIEALMLPAKGTLGRELQVRAFVLSPLLVQTNLRPTEITKHLPPMVSSFREILEADTVGRPLRNVASAQEMQDAGLGPALDRFIRFTSKDQPMGETERLAAFFGQVTEAELLKAIEPMRPQIDRISLHLVNSLTRDEWVGAMAAGPMAGPATLKWLQGQVSLRTNRQDQLAGYAAAVYRARGNEASESAVRFQEAASALRTLGTKRPEDLARRLAKRPEHAPLFNEALLVGAAFLDGAGPMEGPAITTIAKAINAASKLPPTRPLPLGQQYAESLAQVGATGTNSLQRDFAALMVETLGFKPSTSFDYLRPMQAVIDAAIISEDLCDGMDPMDAAFFVLPGTVPGIKMNGSDGLTREMLDRFFRVTVHLRVNGRHGWREGTSAANFKSFLTEVGGLACMRAKFPDEKSIQAGARQILGSPELSGREHFKSTFIPYVMYVREGIDPGQKFWEVKDRVDKPSPPIIQGGSTRHQLPPRGPKGNGYPSRESAPPQKQ